MPIPSFPDSPPFSRKPIWFAPPGRAHLVGVTGAGMKALAEFLFDLGWQVDGCDADPDPQAARSLLQLSLPVYAGHEESHLKPAPTHLIHSPAVPVSHPELSLARNLGLPVLSYVDMLAHLAATRRTIAIAGTHGKSTTTAMLGQILRSANRQASVLCGAESIAPGRSGWAGAGEWLVVEACEYRQHFLQLSPQIICLTGIEADHFDCYPTVADAVLAYQRFVRKLPSDGVLVFNHDCPHTQELVENFAGRKVSFSLDSSHTDWQVENAADGAILFACPTEHHRQIVARLKVPGRHNIGNALAAVATAACLELSDQELETGLMAFAGLRRRFEVLRDDPHLAVVDDYAHHPTEVGATLQAARERFPHRHQICVFQPHQISRTRHLLVDFAAALRPADEVWLLPVHAAREAATSEREELVTELARLIGSHARCIPSLDRVWDSVQTGCGLRPVVLTLGAGSITRVHHELD